MSLLIILMLKGAILREIIIIIVIYQDRIPEPKMQVNHLTRCVT